jgi:hypothetical protein
MATETSGPTQVGSGADGSSLSRGGALGALRRLKATLDRPRLWRLTAALAALLLIAVVAISAQGSLTVLAHPPPAGAASARQSPSWSQWCSHGLVRDDRVHLAYCARVEGIVLEVTHGPARDESHLAVIGDFRIVLVRLDEFPVPGVGSRILAIGPMVRARDGQREIQAFTLRRA